MTFGKQNRMAREQADDRLSRQARISPNRPNEKSEAKDAQGNRPDNHKDNRHMLQSMQGLTLATQPKNNIYR